MPWNRLAKTLVPLCGILLALTATSTAALASGTLIALQSDLDHQLAIAGPADGGYVYDVTAKKTLFSLRANAMRPPASVEKLYTATAALDEMGATARLSTDVYGVGRLAAGGVWEGSVYLRGGGDPTFGSSAFIDKYYDGIGTSILSLVTDLVRHDGIHRIAGTVYGDESFFDSRRGEPSSDYAQDPFLEGTLSGLAYNRGTSVGYHGSHAPAEYAAHVLWGALKGDGVSILGKIAAASTPAGATLLASAPSPTVAQMLGLMLPPSDNFFAETLTKDLGALYGGVGSTSAGAGVVSKTIDAQFGFKPKIVDGSGLSRADQTSPYEVVDLLAGLYGTPTGNVLREHLAIAGRTGTLERRMLGTRAVGRCEGKTGTLTGASNLAGYCTAENGHVLAFAFFNDGVATEYAHVVQDHMTITLADSNIAAAELARARSAGSWPLALERERANLESLNAPTP